MPAPSEHKTVQARILKYAQEIGWRYVPRAEAERRRGLTEGGFPASAGLPKARSNPPINDSGQECPLSVEGKQ
jgi:type I restriction enzyme R subunit